MLEMPDSAELSSLIKSITSVKSFVVEASRLLLCRVKMRQKDILKLQHAWTTPKRVLVVIEPMETRMDVQSLLLHLAWAGWRLTLMGREREREEEEDDDDK